MRSLITVLLALAQRTMALSFTEKVITSTAMGAYSVYAADVNGDGFVDVLSASSRDDKVRVFFSDGNIGNPGFTEQVITSTAMGARSVYAADVNGDGFVDVLLASVHDAKVRAFFNNGNSTNPDFTEKVITPVAPGARSVYATDVNSDGFVEIMSASHGDNKVDRKSVV